MMGIGAVLAGTASAAIRGNTEYMPATLCIIFVVCAQMSANMYYRYYDVTHNCGNNIDEGNSSKAVREMLMHLKEYSTGMFLLAVMTGMAIITMAGAWSLMLGAFIVVAGWLSSGGSLPLLRTPYGIVCSFIFFGPVCVFSTSLIQSMHEASQPLNWYDITPALYMSLAIGLMCINSTMLYGYASYYRDLRNSKASFVTLCGRRITRIIFIVNGALYTAIIIGMCYSLHLNIYSLEMTPSVLCFIIDIYIWWKMRTLPRYKDYTLIDVGNFNVLLMGLLSFLIFEITGVPDDSRLTFFGL